MEGKELKKGLRVLRNGWRRLFSKYISGTKGVISIFLAILMMPILSLSLLLVESVRYQNAMESVQELLASAGLSTLGNYDSYLDERFGLMGIGQGDGADHVSKTFQSYVEKNANVLGKSATFREVSAEGCYPLSDTGVLKQQLLEYSQYTVSTKALSDAVDLDTLLDALGKKMKLDEIEKYAEVAQKSADAVSDVSDALESIHKFKEAQEKYEAAVEDYQKKYVAFKDAVVELAQTIKVEEDKAKKNNSETENQDAEDVYETSAVKKAMEKAEKARDDYKSAAGNVKKEVGTITSSLTSLVKKIQSADRNAQKVDHSTVGEEVDAPGDGVVKENKKATDDYMLQLIRPMVNLVDKGIGKDYQDKAEAVKRKLTDQEGKLKQFKADEVTSSWKEKDVKEKYGPVDTKITISATLASDLDGMIKGMDSDSEVDEYAVSGIEGMMETVDNLLNIKFLYDGALNARVGANYMYTQVNPSLFGSIATDSIETFLSAGHDLLNGLKGNVPGNNIIKRAWNRVKKVVSGLAKILKAAVEFLAGMVAFATTTITQICTLMTKGTQVLENWLLASYVAYDFPSRVDARENGGSSITGYSYGKIYNLAGKKQGSDLGGSLREYAAGGDGTRDNPMFFGAEQEYVLSGEDSEIGNQVAAVTGLFALRMIFDTPTVLADRTVQAIAAFSTIASWVVVILYIILEAACDTLLIVNGRSVYLYKKFCYSTPVGLPEFLVELSKATEVTEGSKTLFEDYEKKQNTKFGRFAKRKGLFGSGVCSMGYNEYMKLMMLLSVSQEDLLKRIQNIIQMESAQQYRTQHQFKLDRAYTYIYSKADVTLNPMFHLDTLTKNGLFRFHREAYSGY